MQSVTGGQPRDKGSILNNFHGNLAQHGIIDGDPSLLKRIALKESAGIAMIRLHLSSSMRRAELARSREPTLRSPMQPGDTVHFF